MPSGPCKTGLWKNLEFKLSHDRTIPVCSLYDPRDNGRQEQTGILGVGRSQKQAVDQGGLCCSRLFQEFRDLELVAAAMPGSLPFMAHQQAPRGLIKHQTPGILIGRGGPAPASVEFTIDHCHIRVLPPGYAKHSKQGD